MSSVDKTFRFLCCCVRTALTTRSSKSDFILWPYYVTHSGPEICPVLAVQELGNPLSASPNIFLPIWDNRCSMLVR